MPVIIFIEGNIAVGKSTFLKTVSHIKKLHDREVTIQCIFEPLNMWQKLVDSDGKNILDRFYQDMNKYAYAFQSYAFLTRVKMLDDISSTADYVFIERSVHSDHQVFAKNCFEQGIMSEIEWKLYQDWFSWMIPKVNSEKHGENMTIYLQSNPETCYKRIKERARPEEKSVTLPYLRNIHAQHEQWLSSENDSVKIIDANLPAHEVVNQVLSKLPIKPIPNIDLSVLGC